MSAAQANNPPGPTAPLPFPSQTGDGLLDHQYRQWAAAEVQRQIDERDRSAWKQKNEDELADAKTAHKLFQATVRTQPKVARMGKATASDTSMVIRRHFSKETASITVEVIRRSYPNNYLIKKVYACKKSPELELVEFYSAEDVEADKANAENGVSGLKKLALPDYAGVVKLLVAQRSPIPYDLAMAGIHPTLVAARRDVLDCLRIHPFFKFPPADRVAAEEAQVKIIRQCIHFFDRKFTYQMLALVGIEMGIGTGEGEVLLRVGGGEVEWKYADGIYDGNYDADFVADENANIWANKVLG